MMAGKEPATALLPEPLPYLPSDGLSLLSSEVVPDGVPE